MQTGQTLGLPIVIFFFGYWDPFSMLPASERMTMDTRLSSLFNLTQKDATIAYLVGLFISGGLFTGYATIYTHTCHSLFPPPHYLLVLARNHKSNIMESHHLSTYPLYTRQSNLILCCDMIC